MLLIFLSMPFLSAQELTVSGRITDKGGEAIIGASILVQGTTSGTITDFDGNFTVPNVASNAVLVVVIHRLQNSKHLCKRENNLQHCIGRRY